MTLKSKHYPDADQNPNFPVLEEAVLARWNAGGTFPASVANRAQDPEFVFYDGPPFANGLPHYGHLLTGFVKDAFARYQTMQGLKVERRFGWDCHGLPAEMGSEKELGISGRAAITEFGIGKFNEHCRTSVMKYTQEWEYYVNRQARWVDFKNDYKTMDKNFMESVLWAFKQLYDKGLVYEAYRVMPYSWAAETPLSNFETKLDNSYREREDKAITVAFELNTPPPGAGDAEVFKIAAWTTTPWTLPSNLALAVGDITYVCVHGRNPKTSKHECHIVSEKMADAYEMALEQLGYMVVRISNLDQTKRDRIIVSKSALVGLSYKPLFPYFKDHSHKAFKILDGSDFVTDGDGTGIVHMAPGFGEEDQKCCEKNGIEVVVPVNGQGKFTDAIYDIRHPDESRDPATKELDSGVRRNDGVFSLKGLNVIAEPGGSKFGLANDRIIEFLKKSGALIKQEQIFHSYPHCWRTDQPLIYRAMPSWYVEVTKFRDRAVELNKQINWIPEHIRDGQMAHMLATAPDWSISRNRFWGTPIPVWRREDSEFGIQDSEIKVFGSIAEMEEFFDLDACLNSSPNPESRILNPRITDLHRPFIDTLTVAKDGSKWTRVEDVFDCWFESGSMPFAQVHYPFENKEWFETHFPADFITEYVGQTRGWFNTLIMLSAALFDKPPFKNCICHGVVLDAETGLKYSKRLKNYKDPKEVMDQYGADALRWMMLASPVMRGMDLSVDPEGKFIRDVVRLAIKPIWNAYNFFCMYANADSIVASDKSSVASENIMDRYILAKCADAVAHIQTAMDAYDSPSACEAVLQFFEVLNNWYIRRNKERFWKEEKDADKQAAYDTLYTVLVTMCKAAAPLLPLTLEEIYRGLTKEESVHLASYPLCHPDESRDPVIKELDSGVRRNDEELIAQMDWVRDVCNAALAIRNKVNIRVRQPLAYMTIATARPIPMVEVASGIFGTLNSIIKDEVNIKDVRTSGSFDDYATLKLSINSQVLGKRLPALMKQILPASKKGEWKQVDGAVEICGEKLLPGEYVLQLEPKPEYAARAQALSTNDALVILDTTITPELEAEGIARDVVRMVQQARKDAGLHVSDHIRLAVVAQPKIAEAVLQHRDYITAQTLAISLENNGFTGASYHISADIEGEKITLFLQKAA